MFRYRGYPNENYEQSTESADEYGANEQFSKLIILLYFFPLFFEKGAFVFFMAKESEKRRNVGKNEVVRITKFRYCHIRQSTHGD